MVRVVNARDMYACLYGITNRGLAAGCKYIHCSIVLFQYMHDTLSISSNIGFL